MNKERSLNLYEYANAEKYDGDTAALESFLDQIWIDRSKYGLSYPDISEEAEFDNSIAAQQKFITILKNNHIKSRRFVGVIKINDTTLNLLPKIFFSNDESIRNANIEAIQANILWWLSYCKKINFPKQKSDLSPIKSNFFEILVYLFATYTKEVLNNYIYQNYIEVSNELGYMKGRLAINQYVKDNISSGNWHKLSCIYDSFEIDNHFNRIIKYVANFLMESTQRYDNRNLLSDILFILDDVSDIRATYADCEKIKLNRLFEDLYVVLDYCKLFLSNSVTYSYKNQLKVFAFLLPMEYVFEDFLFGFMEKHLKHVDGVKSLKYQKSDLYLAKLYENNQLIRNRVFNLQHDIYFEYHGKKIIADTKYKITYFSKQTDEKKDFKWGVSQSDLYQLVSYAIRREASHLYLIYPEILMEKNQNERAPAVKFSIHDEFANKDVFIHIAKVSIIHKNFPNIEPDQNLQKNFETTEILLKDELLRIFKLF